MRYVAAYLLASLGQEGAPSKEKIISILDSVGIDVDNEKLGKVCHPAISILQLHINNFIQVMSELKGKDLNEVIANGMGKLASMPSGTYSPPPPFTKMLIILHRRSCSCV